MMRAGAGLFCVGLVFLAGTVLPFFFHDTNRSLWLNLGCMLAPLGFVIVMLAALRRGRADQAQALAALDRPA